jgi:hypothetical protein
MLLRERRPVVANYRKDQTTVAQTAANNAATVVAALINVSVIDSVESATAALKSIQASVFAELKGVVDTDNALFEKVEKENPAPARNSGGNKGGGGGGTKLDAAAARATVVNFGRFGPQGTEGEDDYEAGLTLAQVEALAPGEGRADGYNDKEGKPKSGLQYIEWLAKSDKNPFMARRATLILEDLKSGSADE